MLKKYLSADMLMMLNLDEFGEKIMINDVEIQAVTEETTKAKSGNRQLNYPGMHGDFLEVFFRIEDYVTEEKKLMRHGEICYVNGKRYTVESVTDEQGMAHLMLAEYRQKTRKNI